MTTGPYGDTPPRSVRNVTVLGPAGAGTSTLVAALAARGPGPAPTGGPAPEPAGPDDGGLGLTPVESEGVRVNLLDTPASPDRAGDREAGLWAGDAVVFVLDATAGLDPLTVHLWERCARTGVPRAVAVTGLDRPGADFDESVAVCQRVLGPGVHPAFLPLLDDDEAPAGLIDLLSGRVSDSSSGRRVERDADPQHLALVEGLRADLVEAVLAGSEDPSLLDHYLAGTALDPATLAAELHAAVGRGELHPVVPLAPLRLVGADELLGLLVRAFPAPLEAPVPVVTRPDGGPAAALSADPAGPLAAQVVQVRGGTALVRVYSGSLRPGQPVRTVAPDGGVGPMLSWAGPPCAAGDLCRAPAAAPFRPGATLCDPRDPLLLAAWEVPEPQLPVALEPVGRDDAVALDAALRDLVAQDRSARLERAAGTDQLLLWAQSEEHAGRLLAALHRHSRVRVGQEQPRVPLLPDAPGQGRREPVSTVRVRVPASYARSVASDLRSRRARVTGTSSGPDDEMAVVEAEVPDLELLTYATALQRVAHGTATFTRRPAGHQPLPG